MYYSFVYAFWTLLVVQCPGSFWTLPVVECPGSFWTLPVVLCPSSVWTLPVVQCPGSFWTLLVVQCPGSFKPQEFDNNFCLLQETRQCMQSYCVTLIGRTSLKQLLAVVTSLTSHYRLKKETKSVSETMLIRKS